ncbi:hypothetical protein [Paenibacillus xylanexedens]|uniref:hypothetical protein n=1 Tax=Paenibacillus xylanexedens TaxID=528191 RepID=UPI0011A85A6E|nr:hypothetical protein [Paenibacillus xylanexedens]
MKYTFENWIQTEYWQGALIKSPTGLEFLTNGVSKWEPNERRKYQVVDRINNESEFKNRWNMYSPYDQIEGVR